MKTKQQKKRDAELLDNAGFETEQDLIDECKDLAEQLNKDVQRWAKAKSGMDKLEIQDWLELEEAMSNCYKDV